MVYQSRRLGFQGDVIGRILAFSERALQLAATPGFPDGTRYKALRRADTGLQAMRAMVRGDAILPPVEQHHQMLLRRIGALCALAPVRARWYEAAMALRPLPDPGHGPLITRRRLWIPAVAALGVSGEIAAAVEAVIGVRLLAARLGPPGGVTLTVRNHTEPRGAAMSVELSPSDVTWLKYPGELSQPGGTPPRVPIGGGGVYLEAPPGQLIRDLTIAFEVPGAIAHDNQPEATPRDLIDQPHLTVTRCIQLMLAGNNAYMDPWPATVGLQMSSPGSGDGDVACRITSTVDATGSDGRGYIGAASAPISIRQGDYVSLRLTCHGDDLVGFPAGWVGDVAGSAGGLALNPSSIRIWVNSTPLDAWQGRTDIVVDTMSPFETNRQAPAGTVVLQPALAESGALTIPYETVESLKEKTKAKAKANGDHHL